MFNSPAAEQAGVEVGNTSGAGTTAGAGLNPGLPNAGFGAEGNPPGGPNIQLGLSFGACEPPEEVAGCMLPNADRGSRTPKGAGASVPPQPDNDVGAPKGAGAATTTAAASADLSNAGIGV